MTIAVTAAVLAVSAGVLLAAYDQPGGGTDRRTRRLSLALVVASSVTAAAGVAYALLV